MRLNATPRIPRPVTHEGGPAARITPLQMLRRSVLSCLLWEDGFYESGVTIADRIASLCELVTPDQIAGLAVEARHVFHLRHVPLLLLDALSKHKGPVVSNAIAATIARPDELAEFLAIYWRKGRHPLSKQVKLGLARAFGRFDAYQLAKYNRDGPVKLRDVLFLCHAKPRDAEQAEIWKKLVDGTLPAPDTWEVALSAGADQAEIRSAYRRRAKALHPDAGGDPEKFRELTRANGILGDEEKRERFDRTGEADETIDRTEETALGMIAAILSGLVNVETPPGIDLVETMRVTIGEEKKRITRLVDSARVHLARLDKLVKRFHTSAPANPVRKILEDRQRSLRADIAGAEDTLRAIQRATEILKTYTFDVEYPPRPAQGEVWTSRPGHTVGS